VSGLEKTLRSVFPIVDFAGTAHLDFDRYELEEPKYDTDECRQRGLTYAAPMRVTLRLTTFEIDPETEAKSVIDIKEQDVYMGDMPLMTMNGTFIINGTERVIVSRCTARRACCSTTTAARPTPAANISSPRASSLPRQLARLRVRRQGHRQRPDRPQAQAARDGAAACAGMTSEEILNTFYNRVSYGAARTAGRIPYSPDQWRGQKPNHEVVDADSGEIVFKANEKITPRRANQAGKDGLKNVIIPTEEIFGRYSAYDLINEKTGEIYIEAGDEVSPRTSPSSTRQGRQARAARHRLRQHRPWMRNTLKADKAEDGDQALSDIYRVMRPGEPPTRETADAFSTACSSTPSATTFRRSAGSSSTCASASTPRTRSRPCARRTSSRSSRSW
jgi:DNA-directed RNA polymerase subunit beta